MPSTLGIVASGEDVFNDAVLWLDTARSVANETTMVNYGKGGSALNATYGSSAGADTNDPLLLTHSGTNYLYLPGVSSNSASTPDASVLDVTGDLDVTIDFSVDNFLATYIAVSKDEASQRSWIVLVAVTTGRVVFEQYNGTALVGSASCSASLVAGQRTTVRVVKPAGVAGGVQFFYDGVSQSKAADTTTSAALVNTTASLRIGANFVTANPLPGRVYRVTVKDGSTTVFDANFATGITSGGQTTFTESSANAATVTINRATSGRKSVAVVRNVLLFGTDDYLEIADNDLLDFGASDSFTVAVVHRAWGTQSTGTSLVAKKANTTATTQGWMLGSGTTTALQGQSQVGDGTNGTTAVSASRTAGALSTSTLVRNVAADTVTTYLGATAGTPVTDATTGTSANAEAVRVGRLSGAGTGYFDGEIVAVAVWRRALNANEVATVNARYA